MLAMVVDDRFIMKQMVKQEVQSFLDFGPYYFDYLTESLTDSGFPKVRFHTSMFMFI